MKGTPMSNYVKKLLVGGAGVAALAVGGSAIADAATSHAGTTTTTTPAPPPAHGTAAHEDAEKAVTGADAAKAQAAAVKALGGGTAGAVTTDCRGSGYEVTVTTSDGSSVEVHLDASFDVLQGPPDSHGGPPPGAPRA
jgi:hypothetical protein